tara:strand:- start:4788 stop:6035 length:1248 start_codon:yes stop_codon:yes gene_type:complete
VATIGCLCLTAPTLGQSLDLTGDGTGTDNDRLVPGRYPADPVLSSGAGLREPYDPAFDLDWSLALRGTFTKATSGERFDIRAVPSVSIEQVGTRSTLKAGASAEVTRPSSGAIDVNGLRLSGATDYAVDRDTTLTAVGRFSLTRAVAGTPGVASTIAIAPQNLTGGGDLGVTRQFGKFNIGITGSADRYAYGTTTLTSGAVVDNADENVWALEAGLRAGFQVTPIFEVFGRTGLGRNEFDRPSASLGLKPNATTASLEAGVTGRWSDILEATASTGITMRRFDAASLGEVSAQTYDAQISFQPDPTLRLTTGFATTVAPPGPNGAGTTRIGYAANAELAYTVNSWLALRALADWNRASFVGSPATESGYGWGLGGDYKLNAHTALTADYNYDQSETSASGIQDAHQVVFGVTLAR